jgi:hypothetical protein
VKLSGSRKEDGSSCSSRQDCISRFTKVAVGDSAELAADKTVRGRFAARSFCGFPLLPPSWWTLISRSAPVPSVDMYFGVRRSFLTYLLRQAREGSKER